jgi:hypothetical protein
LPFMNIKYIIGIIWKNTTIGFILLYVCIDKLENFLKKFLKVLT